MRIVSIITAAVLLGLWAAPGAGRTSVALLRTPNGGIQPQAAVDSLGVVHLIYYKGDPYKGDLYYVREVQGSDTFSKPIQVNTQLGSAIAAGTIRGAQMALGKNGRVHVAWNGPVPKDGTHSDAPMLYTRLSDEGTAFERERNLITYARGLDGGGAVAADNQGHVYVFWHAPKPGNADGEAGRAVFVAQSADDGRTFLSERLATLKPTGACACCGMEALAGSEGRVFALYRAATETVNRDETLLISSNRGTDFEIVYQHGWKTPTCPMSSASLFQTSTSLLAAAETHGRVYFIRVNSETGRGSAPISPDVKGKHPAVAGNAAGEVLLAWTEGTGWGKGGSLAWQLYDADGQPIGGRGRAEGVPAWSLVAVVPKPDGNFLIIY